jgi:hypothetical protein
MRSDDLTAAACAAITEYIEMLKPLKAATKRLEGRSQSERFGAIAEIIPVSESILTYHDVCVVRRTRQAITTRTTRRLGTTSQSTCAQCGRRPASITPQETTHQPITLLLYSIRITKRTATQSGATNLTGLRQTTAGFALFGRSKIPRRAL